MPFIRVFRTNLSNSVKLAYKRLRSRLILAAAYLSRGLFKPRLIFARINGPIMSWNDFSCKIVQKLIILFSSSVSSFHDQPTTDFSHDSNAASNPVKIWIQLPFPGKYGTKLTRSFIRKLPFFSHLLPTNWFAHLHLKV